MAIKTIFKRFYSVDNNSTQGIRAMTPCTGDKIPNQKWPFSPEKNKMIGKRGPFKHSIDRCSDKILVKHRHSRL